MEQYAYDPLWRMVAIYRRLAVDPQTGQRPPPVLYQRFVYHAAGAGGAFSTGIGMDRPILRQRDTDGNGVPDETLYYLFDRRGSVVGLAQTVIGDSMAELEGEGGAGPTLSNDVSPTIGRTLVERVRYSPFGVPTCYVPSDLNRDGVTNDEEVASNYWYFGLPTPPPYDDRFDINYDGVIDGADEAIYWEHYDAIGTTWHAGDFRGEGRLSFTARELGGTAPGTTPALPQTGFARMGQLDIDNRFGYAGYIWDQHLGVYHVRHRAYDPFAGRWLQPDPLALMGPELLLALTSSDGSNLYAYVGNNPNGFVDPFGLWRWFAGDDLLDQIDTEGNAFRNSRGIRGDPDYNLGSTSKQDEIHAGKIGEYDAKVQVIGRVAHGVGEILITFVPGPGEVQDFIVIIDGEEKTWVRATAAASLIANVATVGTAPNAGGAIKGGRRAWNALTGEEAEILAKYASRAKQIPEQGSEPVVVLWRTGEKPQLGEGERFLNLPTVDEWEKLSDAAKKELYWIRNEEVLRAEIAKGSRIKDSFTWGTAQGGYAMKQPPKGSFLDRERSLLSETHAFNPKTGFWEPKGSAAQSGVSSGGSKSTSSSANCDGH